VRACAGRSVCRTSAPLLRIMSWRRAATTTTPASSSRGQALTRRIADYFGLSYPHKFTSAASLYILADGAIELVIEGVPCSALIEASQSSELIFCDRSARLRRRKHAADGGKFCCDLQEHSGAPLASSNWLGPGPLGLVIDSSREPLKRTRREQALAAHHGCRNVIENYRLR
jgi:hypothetical protein